MTAGTLLFEKVLIIEGGISHKIQLKQTNVLLQVQNTSVLTLIANHKRMTTKF